MLSAPLAGCTAVRLREASNREDAGIIVSEERLSQDRYRIAYSAPVGQAEDRVDAMVLHHAAGVTIDRRRLYFRVVERAVSRDVYVLQGEHGVATYRGGFADWNLYWRLFCTARIGSGCGVNPLWLSSKPPKRRIEVAYVIDVLADREPGLGRVNASMLLTVLPAR